MCREYHLDPASGIADDFIASQFRLGLLVRRSDISEEPDHHESVERDLERIHDLQRVN